MPTQKQIAQSWNDLQINLGKTDTFEISGIPESIQYTGMPHKPSVTVIDARTREELVEGTDYTVKYSFNTALGTAKITVSGKKKYTGSVIKTFKIVW